MRSSLVRVAVAVLLVLVTAGCDWTTFGYNSAHTHSNETENVIGVANVASLSSVWTATTGNWVDSSPAVANGKVYVGSEDGILYAFDASGANGCSDAPLTCTPVWSARDGLGGGSSPAVANGVVYIGSYDSQNYGWLYAFDADGSPGCSDSPDACAPMWTAKVSGIIQTSPVVVNGVVYIGSDDGYLYAFDAAGSSGCSGTPKVCAPLWAAQTAVLTTNGNGTQSSPAVVNGVVYIEADDGNLYTFDAAGVTGCSGVPKRCTPLWKGHMFDSHAYNFSSPSIANGIVYAGGADLYAFDAAGVRGCSGTPTVCAPLWTYTGGGASPAIAHGIVYGHSGHQLLAFDASGSTGCSGTPKVCTALWSGDIGGQGVSLSSPSIANGVAYIGSQSGSIFAFDAAGSSGCSGIPKVCTPLWSATTGARIDSSPTIANGFLYVGSNDNNLYTFKPSTPLGAANVRP